MVPIPSLVRHRHSSSKPERLRSKLVLVQLRSKLVLVQLRSKLVLVQLRSTLALVHSMPI